jgi:hypothetical protein
MVFEDSSQAATTTGSKYLGEGFRLEPEFRDPTTPTVPVVPGQPLTVPALGETPAVTTTAKRITPNLDTVFDDPEDGEPGRDRMLVHGLWEVVLALAVAGVGYLLWRSDSHALTSGGLHTLFLSATVLGVAAVGAALSLRTAAPNLAIGAVAVAAAQYFAHHAGTSFVQPMLVVIGLAAAVGALQGLVVVGLHVPGWAAGVGAALALFAWSVTQPTVSLGSGYNPTADAYWWFGGLAVVSIVAAFIGVITPVRRAVGRFRPVADPADRRRLLAAVITFVGTVGSSVLGAVAGVLALAVDRTSPAPGDALQITGLALGVALLGGTSAYGRRGGFFGTILAAALVAVGMAYASHTQPTWSEAGFAAAAIGLGLVVTRLVEQFGRPAPAKPDDRDEDWVPRVHAATTTTASALTTPTGGWATLRPPAQTAVGGIWAGDDAWGTGGR